MVLAFFLFFSFIKLIFFLVYCNVVNVLISYDIIFKIPTFRYHFFLFGKPLSSWQIHAFEANPAWLLALVYT